MNFLLHSGQGIRVNLLGALVGPDNPVAPWALLNVDIEERELWVGVALRAISIPSTNAITLLIEYVYIYLLGTELLYGYLDLQYRLAGRL